MSKIAFLDRDGTLMDDVGYPKDPADVVLLDHACDALVTLQHLGYTLAVVSNQSGVGRGLITPQEAEAVHQRFVQLVHHVTGITLPCWYCPNHPDENCDCRKPKPGLLREASAALGVPITVQSIMIGDKLSDVEAGQAAGCGLNLLFRGDWPAMLDLIHVHMRGHS